MITEDKEHKSKLQCSQRNQCQYFGIISEIESSCCTANDNNSKVDDTSQETQLKLIHHEMLFKLVGASWENTMIKVDENIGESHEDEDSGGWFGLLLFFRGRDNGSRLSLRFFLFNLFRHWQYYQNIPIINVSQSFIALKKQISEQFRKFWAQQKHHISQMIHLLKIDPLFSKVRLTGFKRRDRLEVLAYQQNYQTIEKQKIMIKSNKIINNSLSMLKNSDNLTTRKKLEDYSYCLGHNIGKGYSSHVYKGRNDLSDETVAIKVIDMRMLKGEVHRNLLASQIEVLKTFKYSKNIIQVFDIYTTKNNTYIITEFCEGGDLSKMIAGKRGMPESQAISIIKQVIDGYSEISSNRIIHRDLKPANILLKNNHIKIADFGFAMKASESKKYSSYNVGSPIYMPPEALNDNKYSFKSDIWAIGVIFYELLTGKTPWRAKTEKELGRQLLSVPIDRLLPKNISDVSAEFLKKSLAVNYDRRMNPDELFAFKFDSHYIVSQFKTASQISGNGTQTSIKNSFKDIENKKRQTSLSKNTINTPKNLDRFNFMRNGNTHANLDENKNLSLPKTASTIHNRTHTALQTNTTINTAQNIKVTIDRKQISKELLSQIHLCRFVYKLLQRIQHHLENAYGVNQLQSSMKGLIFQKLTDVLELNCMNDEKKARQYKKTQDYQKISQIIDQYQKKYEKDLGDTSEKWNGLSRMDSELGQSIKQLYGEIKSLQSLNEGKEKVIILDYLITLKQLGNLLEKNDIEIFHQKSKIEAIVEGAPAKNITNEHVRAISAKLKAIKLL